MVVFYGRLNNIYDMYGIWLKGFLFLWKSLLSDFIMWLVCLVRVWELVSFRIYEFCAYNRVFFFGMFIWFFIMR